MLIHFIFTADFEHKLIWSLFRFFLIRFEYFFLYASWLEINNKNFLIVWFLKKSCNLFFMLLLSSFEVNLEKSNFRFLCMHALAMIIDLEKKSCWQYKSDLFYVALFCGSIGLRSMSEPISASFSPLRRWIGIKRTIVPL